MPTFAHLPPANADNTTSVIIAGGEARRMGGQNKALLMLDGKPLIAHVMEIMRSQTNRVAINANRDVEKLAQLGVPVFTDDESFAAGPLRGLLAAFSHTQTPWILTVPCDTPQLPHDLAEKFFDAVAKNNVPLAVAHDGVRLQSLCLLMHRSLATGLQEFLNSKRRAVHHWIEQTPHTSVDFCAQAAKFININTPEDLLGTNPESV